VSLLVLYCSAKNQEASVLVMREELGKFVCRKELFSLIAFYLPISFCLLCHNIIIKCACFFLVGTVYIARLEFKTKNFPALCKCPGSKCLAVILEAKLQRQFVIVVFFFPKCRQKIIFLSKIFFSSLVLSCRMTKQLSSVYMVLSILCLTWKVKQTALAGDLEYMFSSAESRAMPKAPLNTLDLYVHGPRGLSNTHTSVSKKCSFLPQRGGKELAAWLLPN